MNYEVLERRSNGKKDVGYMPPRPARRGFQTENVIASTHRGIAIRIFRFPFLVPQTKDRYVSVAVHVRTKYSGVYGFEKMNHLPMRLSSCKRFEELSTTKVWINASTDEKRCFFILSLKGHSHEKREQRSCAIGS
jgi:hypothetical protein